MKSSSNSRAQNRASLRYIVYRVKSDLVAESAKNYLSYVWWIIEPALLIGVFYFVFGVLFQRGGEGFASSLVLGVSAWLWFSGSVLRAMVSIRRESQLMLLVYVPKYVFPAASVLFSLFKQVFVFVLIIALLAVMNPVSPGWLFFILVFLVQALLIVSVSLLLAAIIPFLPDLSVVIGALLPMGMFVSGVFFSIDQVPADLQVYFLMNPMAGLISEYRNVLLYDQLPNFSYLASVSAICIVIMIGSLWILNRFDRIYPRLVNR